MLNIKKYLLILMTCGAIVSCTDDLAELNIDPNNSPSANPAQVLSAAEAYIAYTVDAQYNSRSAIWAQYWTWGPGVAIGNIERYVSDGTDYDNGWARMYSGALVNLDFVDQSSSSAHAGIAKILKAYCYQQLVDHFGDVPFSESLKGASDGNFAPAYDDDAAIYAALIPMIDAGIAQLADVGSEDFIYGGDAGKWEKFANSLKLKILMRQSQVNDVSAAVRALVAEGNFIESGDDIAQMTFTGVTGSENPMYASFERSLGLFYIASSTSMNILQDDSDPRLAVFYNRATASGNFVSIRQGSIDSEPFTNGKSSYSVGGTAAYAKDSPTILMSPWEVWFLRAEAAARFGTSDDAAMAFANAIDENFNYLGLSGGAEYAATLNFDGQASLEAKMALIGKQKWISMNGTQEDEAWIESRRMNTASNPFFTSPTDGIYVRPLVSTLPDGVHPSIWLYPQTEQSLNGSAPQQRSLTDKVFWDN